LFNLDKTTIDTSNTENNNNTDKLSAKNYENLNQYDKNLINKLTEILDNNNFTELSKIATQFDELSTTNLKIPKLFIFLIKKPLFKLFIISLLYISNAIPLFI